VLLEIIRGTLLSIGAADHAAGNRNPHCPGLFRSTRSSVRTRAVPADGSLPRQAAPVTIAGHAAAHCCQRPLLVATGPGMGARRRNCGCAGSLHDCVHTISLRRGACRRNRGCAGSPSRDKCKTFSSVAIGYAPSGVPTPRCVSAGLRAGPCRLAVRMYIQCTSLYMGCTDHSILREPLIDSKYSFSGGCRALLKLV
jgi:hypothetical protein